METKREHMQMDRMVFYLEAKWVHVWPKQETNGEHIQMSTENYDIWKK